MSEMKFFKNETDNSPCIYVQFWLLRHRSTETEEPLKPVSNSPTHQSATTFKSVRSCQICRLVAYRTDRTQDSIFQEQEAMLCNFVLLFREECHIPAPRKRSLLSCNSNVRKAQPSRCWRHPHRACYRVCSPKVQVSL